MEISYQFYDCVYTINMTNILTTAKKILEKLLALAFTNQQTYAKTQRLNFDTESVLNIIKAAKELIISEQTLLSLPAPIIVFGDLCSQYFDLLRWFEFTGLSLDHFDSFNGNYLFLGNYINGGKYGLETILTLFCLKIVHPSKIWLLRGNMETQSLAKVAGFQHQCISRISKQVYQSFLNIFSYLPISAVIQNKILCLHGGLSPQLIDLANLATIYRPQPNQPESLVNDILWSDPSQTVEGWSPNYLRNKGHYFGPQVVNQFLKRNNLSLICRSHQICQNGYKISSQSQIITIFSAPNYLNRFENNASSISISESLQIQFLSLKPEQKNNHPTEKKFIQGEREQKN